ncbi:hypothetical protein Desdi_0015 [Desulfitobacterium dichloroeliminans LMG P-21439]|uniref:Uncharacterized protein n=1 Tax=Desulfitobacterium dichloroeliminans (strain LMG P-21439 / DCA1) TaxID=871963 RepID=L0F3G0_DESDL|nr:hypothetical protein [Desulfitobacterium dichloroeliminans]AGA67590.1 hypothetical protein Desdi_0015 [Desulfitobacterium dichloroeliminans LMG P-21439]
MKHLIRNPAINAIGLCIFTAFYGLIFIITPGHMEFENLLYYNRATTVEPFWTGWSDFLASGYHAYIAYALIALSIVVVLMLLLRRHPYDEYHADVLIQCLAVATILTLAAIAIFYLMVLSNANGIVEKFTLFIVIHWATVVLADLVYVLVCRWR